MRTLWLGLAPCCLLLLPACFEDPTPSGDTSVGDEDTSGDGDDGSEDPSTGDGDGDPSTGDGDGDGDPSTGDGDPSTGDGDPSTGDGDPACDDEFVHYDMFANACEEGNFWIFNGTDVFNFIDCAGPPGVDSQGWGRTVDPADGVEGAFSMPKAIEMGTWAGADGALAGVDFDGFDLADLCQPRLRMEIACGYSADPGCEVLFRVQIKDSALPFDAEPLEELAATEIPDGEASVVDIDLSPYQDKVLNFTILIDNLTYDTGDVMVFGWPRIVANQ